RLSQPLSLRCGAAGGPVPVAAGLCARRGGDLADVPDPGVANRPAGAVQARPMRPDPGAGGRDVYHLLQYHRPESSGRRPGRGVLMTPPDVPTSVATAPMPQPRNGNGFSPALPQGQPVVRVTGLNHFFGEGEARKQVLFDNNLELMPGEIVIMTGPSGS